MTKHRVFALCVLVAVLCHAVAALARERVIPPGHERDFTELAAPYKLPGPLVADRVLANIDIHPGYVEFEITRGNEHGPRLALLRMSVDNTRPDAFRYSTNPPENELDATTRDAVTRLETTVRAHATARFAAGVLSAPAVLVDYRPRQEPTPRALWLIVVALGVTLGLGLLKGRTQSPRALVAVGVATAVAIVAFGWFVSERGQVTQRFVAGWSRELARSHALASLALAIALGALMAIGDRAAAWWRQSQDVAARRGAGRTALEVMSVLAWSLFVRLALTQTNILTDGGSGYRRLMEFVGGYGGLSVLVNLVVPQRLMWSAIHVPVVLAALAPPLLTLLGRVLRFRRPIPLLAGLMLASLPLHAAMYSSDFLMGPLLTLTLLGLVLAALGARADDDLTVLAGACLLAYGTWCRPEAAVAGAPLLAVAWPVVKGWRKHPLAWLGFGLFGANMIAAQLALIAEGPAQPFALHPFWPNHLGVFLIPEDVPYWLSLGVVLGIALLKRMDRRLIVLVAVGVASGLLPLSIRGANDVTGSYMEVFRYGTWALPWLVLLAATGLSAAVRALAARFGAREQRVYVAALIGLVAVVLSSPVRAHRYLARQYGPLAEERVFREALGRAPGQCTLVVPDDVSDLVRNNRGTIEIQARYSAIAFEQALKDGRPTRTTVGVTAFLDSLTQQGWPHATSGGAPLCYWFFEGSYCFTGADGTPPKVCEQLLQRVHARPVMDKPIEYVSHRFVTRPDLHTPPLYDPHQHLRLFQLSAPPD